MHLALPNFLLSPDLEQNLAAMDRLICQSASQGADLVLFPEAAPTGLNNNDDPQHDLPLGTPIPGPITTHWCELARRHGIWIAAGLLERDENCLYDSAVVVDSAGELRIHYRRIQPQWHAAVADPAVYRQGDSVGVCDSPWGRLAVLLCGDLFDDAICDQLRQHSPDLLLFPFARNFGDGSCDQNRWDQQELPEYLARVGRIGCPAAMVNELADRRTTDSPAFGGAWLCDANGVIRASRPLGTEGLLVAQLVLPASLTQHPGRPGSSPAAPPSSSSSSRPPAVRTRSEAPPPAAPADTRN